MILHELLAQMTTELGEEPRPMKLLSLLAPDAVLEHAANKNFIFGKRSIPAKYKLLASIAIAAALGSETCTATYVKSGLRKGLSREEITEAILLARFVKASTVLAAAVPAMEALAGTPQEG